MKYRVPVRIDMTAYWELVVEADSAKEAEDLVEKDAERYISDWDDLISLSDIEVEITDDARPE